MAFWKHTEGKGPIYSLIKKMSASRKRLKKNNKQKQPQKPSALKNTFNS